MIKRTSLEEFRVNRYSKPISCMKLKDGDLLSFVDEKDLDEIFISTNNGYGLRFKASEVPTVGIKASGVKGISLKNDYVVGASSFDNNYPFISIITNKQTAKRVNKRAETISRARKGVLIIRDVKTNPYKIIKTFIMPSKTLIVILIMRVLMR